jgi:hypothetical protein
MHIMRRSKIIIEPKERDLGGFSVQRVLPRLRPAATLASHRCKNPSRLFGDPGQP